MMSLILWVFSSFVFSLFVGWELVIGLLVFGMIYFYFIGIGVEGFQFFCFGSLLDNVSISLMVLSFWITLLMFMASIYVQGVKSKIYGGLMFFLLVVLLLTFMVDGVLFFYFMFEISLIPTILIILGWGYQPERIQAGVYFLFYTLGASLPLLFLIMSLYVDVGSVFFLSLSGVGFNKFIFWGVFLLGAFLVKMPMFLVHLWLPKAHVEAPVAGSMILAGVLLKLGGYGIIRIMDISFDLMKSMSYVFVSISLIGMIYVGIKCCLINDLSVLVAYSSVAHMGMVIISLFIYVYWGFIGGLLMMLAHGVCSSGLFAFVNLLYERSNSRSMFINKGMISIFSVWSFMFFMLSVINIASPPSLNLLSEIMIMASMVSFSWVLLLLFSVGSFLGAVYTLLWYSYSQHGGSSLFLCACEGSSHRESHCVILHLVPLNIVFLNVMLVLS